MGVKQLYPDSTSQSSEGRRAALRALLHTLLLTYLQLLDVLLKGPPSIQAEQDALNRQHQQLRQEYENRQRTGVNGVTQETAPPEAIATEADRAIDHLRLCAVNIHHLCNEWRPVQARETLKMLMQNQIDERRERTAELQKTCAELKDRLDKPSTAPSRVNAEGLASERPAIAAVAPRQDVGNALSNAPTRPSQPIPCSSKQSMWQLLDDVR